MKIKIKTLTGKTIILNVVANNNILDIKKMIQKSEGIPVDQQRLVFAGKQLQEGHTVSDYGIKANDAISLILRLRGGMAHPSSYRAHRAPPQPAASSMNSRAAEMTALRDLLAMMRNVEARREREAAAAAAVLAAQEAEASAAAAAAPAVEGDSLSSDAHWESAVSIIAAWPADQQVWEQVLPMLEALYIRKDGQTDESLRADFEAAMAKYKQSESE